jgi:hypothetical protein
MYSPKIKPEHIKPLYLLGKEKRRPMTQLVNEAVEQYLAKEVSHGRNDAT